MNPEILKAKQVYKTENRSYIFLHAHNLCRTDRPFLAHIRAIINK